MRDIARAGEGGILARMTAERATSHLMSVEDYLEWEDTQDQKYEYVGGMVYAMAGGTIDHASISANVLGSLYGRLRGKPCRALGSDLKVRIEYPTHTRFYYPDVTVICKMGPGQARYHDKPVVVVEVASESTRRVDELEKKDAYLSIPSLCAYIQMEQDAAVAVVWRRNGAAFDRETYHGLDAVILLPEIGATLPLSEAYEAIHFPPAAVAD